MMDDAKNIWKDDLKKENKSVGEAIGGAIGKEIGAEIGKEVEKHVKGHDEGHDEEKEAKAKKKKKKKSPAMRRASYIFGIFFAILFLWIINNYENLGWKFITQDFDQVVDIVRFSIYLSIIVYGLFIFYDKKLFYFLGKLAVDGISIYISVRLFQVFPFDFNHLFGGWGWLNDVFPYLLILGVIVAGISIIVRTGKYMVGKNIYD